MRQDGVRPRSYLATR